MSLSTRGMGKGGGPLASGGMGRVQGFFGDAIDRFRNFVVTVATAIHLRVQR